jgi:hypothetical protein
LRACDFKPLAITGRIGAKHVAANRYAGRREVLVLHGVGGRNALRRIVCDEAMQQIVERRRVLDRTRDVCKELRQVGTRLQRRHRRPRRRLLPVRVEILWRRLVRVLLRQRRPNFRRHRSAQQSEYLLTLIILIIFLSINETNIAIEMTRRKMLLLLLLLLLERESDGLCALRRERAP